MLNAFRQSKEFHSSGEVKGPFWAICAQRLSAIKGISPASKIFLSDAPDSAQRLSAIKGISHSLRSAESPISCVLNAFRQSKEFHGAAVGINADATTCSTPFGNQRNFTPLRAACQINLRISAQRLSAIKGISPDSS